MCVSGGRSSACGGVAWHRGGVGVPAGEQHGRRNAGQETALCGKTVVLKVDPRDSFGFLYGGLN